MSSRSVWTCFAALATLASCGKGASPPRGGAAAAVVWSGETLALGGLAMRVPAGWKTIPVTSQMRRAQYELPAEAGDAAPAELVVYYFGAQGAGSVDANLDRWYGQFEQADGRPSKDVAVVEHGTVAGASVTQVDLSGRYVAQMSPGAEDRHDEAGYRMLAAIVDGGEGAYYLKLVGPQRTVTRWQTPFREMIGSLHRLTE